MPEHNQIQDIVEDLLLDIEEEKCVLLIGPEMVEIGGRSLMQFVHEEVSALEAEHIDYYYPKDGLFLFRDEAGKNKVARRVKRLYRSLELPFEAYRKILELPVPLIISLNPDTFLAEAAQRLGLPHHFSHFRYSGEAIQEVDVPTGKRPVLYNLCGCRMEEESLILDYEDLFRLLRAVLPDGLPNKIRLHLREASSFLFLGFDFEKWYSQLLLQLLTGERKGRPKIAFKTNLQDGSAKNFLMHQFQIQFLGDDPGFMDGLYQALAKAGRLRKLTPTGTLERGAVQQARQMILKGAVREALDIAARLPLPAGQRDQILLLIARYQAWKKEKVSGTYLPGEAEPLLNQITKDFLGLLNDLA